MSLHQLLLNSNLTYFILFVFRIFPCKISIKHDNRINLQTLNQFFRISIFEIYEEKHRKTRLSDFLVNLDNWHVTENSKIQLAVVYLGWSINLQRKWGKFIDFPYFLISKIVFRMIESFSPIKATLFSTYFLFKLEITWETVSVCAN